MPICVGFLSGVPRQGRVGVGYSAVYGVEETPASEPSLTVDDLDRAISEIEEATGPGSAARTKATARIRCSLAPQRRRAISSGGCSPGELRQGALGGVMADAVARAAGVPGEIARRALMLSGDLTRNGRDRDEAGESQALREVGFEIFRPILPMLASTAASVDEAVSSFDCASVEWKLDGIRIQIHRRGEEVRIYTRNLNEITATLPGIVAAVLDLPVAQAVLDGEALWMIGESPASFQDTVSQIDRDAPPDGIVTFLFDLLHVDGEDLLERPCANGRRGCHRSRHI